MLGTIKPFTMLIGVFLIVHDLLIEHWLKSSKLSFRKKFRFLGFRVHHSYVGVTMILGSMVI